jgi:two-component system chemotaxis response regulator CheB
MIRVMVVDDSPLVRKIVTDIFNSTSGIDVAATASSGEIALRRIDTVKPDVITMDIEMPGIGGVKAIKQIMDRRPTPIIVLSAFAKRGAELTLQALECGAVDFICKPSSTLSGGVADISKELIGKVQQASTINLERKTSEKKDRKEEHKEQDAGRPDITTGGPYDLVAIGASTGGPVALKTVLGGLRSDLPVGVVIVQHMPPVFTRAFAGRLDSLCDIRVKEASDGDNILPGVALIAPGDQHMTVTRTGGRARVKLHMWEPISGHRPSVDVLMHSVSKVYGSRAIGVIMTGMGKDGAEGIRGLKVEGGFIIAQDERTSVVFGMNREVIRNGDADYIAPVKKIAQIIESKVRREKEGFNNAID